MVYSKIYLLEKGNFSRVIKYRLFVHLKKYSLYWVVYIYILNSKNYLRCNLWQGVNFCFQVTGSELVTIPQRLNTVEPKVAFCFRDYNTTGYILLVFCYNLRKLTFSSFSCSGYAIVNKPYYFVLFLLETGLVTTCFLWSYFIKFCINVIILQFYFRVILILFFYSVIFCTNKTCLSCLIKWNMINVTNKYCFLSL